MSFSEYYKPLLNVKTIALRCVVNLVLFCKIFVCALNEYLVVSA